MNLQDRILALHELGIYLSNNQQELKEIYPTALARNAWFVPKNIQRAIDNICQYFLDKEKITTWVTPYEIKETIPKKVGLVLAGNIPLVGFHDIMCCFLSGHYAYMKYSEKDNVLYPYICHLLKQINPETVKYFVPADKLNNIDAVIATGSDNSAKHFEYYFRSKPKIIRKNRNGVAVINQNNSKKEIVKLGKDIFTYFGLGCRNVSKVYFPKGFDLSFFMKCMHDEYKSIINLSKYKNNYDYNYAIFSLGQEDFLMSGCLLLKEDSSLRSRISCLHYEWYEDLEILAQGLKSKEDQIQCICSTKEISGLNTIDFGASQQPKLDQYADDVDTIKFLTSL